jgi:hypothetical protein
MISPRNDKIATSTAVSASTEVDHDEKTDANSVAAIVDPDDTDHHKAEETAPAAVAANLCKTSAKSEDADSEDDQPKISTAATQTKTAAQSAHCEAIAEPIAENSD